MGGREYRRSLGMLEEHGGSLRRCIPHGRRPGLAGTESHPDLFQPCGGFPHGLEEGNGRTTMPDLPGIGFEGPADLYPDMRARSE
jgi:L-alanine-DL-glutamate epimerase-like enolase superfamily enzyme